MCPTADHSHGGRAAPASGAPPAVTMQTAAAMCMSPHAQVDAAAHLGRPRRPGQLAWCVVCNSRPRARAHTRCARRGCGRASGTANTAPAQQTTMALVHPPPRAPATLAMLRAICVAATRGHPVVRTLPPPHQGTRAWHAPRARLANEPSNTLRAPHHHFVCGGTPDEPGCVRHTPQCSQQPSCVVRPSRSCCIVPARWRWQCYGTTGQQQGRHGPGRVSMPAVDLGVRESRNAHACAGGSPAQNCGAADERTVNV